MTGHWQKEFPTKDGEYWVANHEGVIGPVLLMTMDDGIAYFPCFAEGGLWWSEPIKRPPKPDLATLKEMLNETPRR